MSDLPGVDLTTHRGIPSEELNGSGFEGYWVRAEPGHEPIPSLTRGFDRHQPTTTTNRDVDQRPRARSGQGHDEGRGRDHADTARRDGDGGE
jgi:hypothetical protein